MQEVARALIDGGIVERGDDGWRMTGDTTEIVIPETIQSLITVGLDRLPESARRTLQTAAVIGRTFEEELLVAVVDRPGVRDDLRELVRRDLIRVTSDGSQPEFTFRHALTQEAAYGTLLAKHRRAAHRRVAEVLEETAGTISRRSRRSSPSTSRRRARTDRPSRMRRWPATPRRASTRTPKRRRTTA